MVAACLKEGVEVVGITDHFRIASSQSLAKALTDAGIHVLSGFETAPQRGRACAVPLSGPYLRARSGAQDRRVQRD